LRALTEGIQLPGARKVGALRTAGVRPRPGALWGASIQLFSRDRDRWSV